MGSMHETFTPITAKDIAKKEGVDIATIRFRWNSVFAKGTFNSNRELTQDEIAAISRNASTKKAAPRKAAPVKDFIRIDTPAPVTPAPAEPGSNMSPARREWGWREYVLLALAFAPALASMRNMRNITHAISGNETDAVLITAVLSMAPVGFVVAGVRGRLVIGLSVLLILYESFCNLTRIYGGLMNVGKSGYPTRFLGLVTDIFNSGSHGTAIALAAFTAFFIAAVQYAAVFELNKK